MSAGGARVAVIGLGSMGAGMAASLARAGFAVTGFDRSEAATARFVAAGGAAAPSAAAAADGATAVVTVVVNAAQTAQVLAEGVLDALPQGGLVISCATMSPHDARGLESSVEGAGKLFVDAPISGGSVRAAEGQLTIMASGRDAAMRAAGPLLAAMARTVHALGDRAGIAAAFKVVNQLLAGVHIAAACEAIAFAAREGLDLRRVYEVITGAAGNSWMFENRVPHVLDGDYAPRSATDIFTKDLGIVADMARAARLPTPIAAAALQMFLMTSAAGMGGDDDSSVARVYARLAGLDLPDPR